MTGVERGRRRVLGDAVACSQSSNRPRGHQETSQEASDNLNERNSGLDEGGSRKGRKRGWILNIKKKIFK